MTRRRVIVSAELKELAEIQARLAALRAARRWRRKNPEKIQQSRRKRKYGLSPADYEQLLRMMGGTCPICRSRPAVVVDHCHATGKVRGLLCRQCNSGLGLLGEDPARLRHAAAYLEMFQ